MSTPIENTPSCRHRDGCQNQATNNVTIQTKQVLQVLNLCKEHLKIVQQGKGIIIERKIAPTGSTLPESFQPPFFYGTES